MTLIAFAAYGKKRAEFVTDTWAYNAVADWSGQCTKHLVLNHLDAAALNTGPIDFCHMFRAVVLEASVGLASFDELADGAPSMLLELRRFWREHSPAGSRTGAHYQPTVALVGWSDRAQEFAGFVFAAASDFDPTVPEGLWVSTSTETQRANPARLDDWRALALKARRDASEVGGIPVGGDVVHTKIERGSAITKRIHTFNDGGEEFAKMVEGTAHPVALARDCYCGSGSSFGDCHVSDLLAKPCYCESGSPLGQCCLHALDNAQQVDQRTDEPIREPDIPIFRTSTAGRS